MACRLVLSIALIWLVGCSIARPPQANPAPVPPPTIEATAALPTRPPPPAVASVATPSPSPTPCGYGPATRRAELQSREVREASALAASGRQPGLYWTLNDSGNEPLLFALGEDGRDLGVFLVESTRNEDWESLQVGPGQDGGPALYIGDTGDNQHLRLESIIDRVPEPNVGPESGRPARGRAGPAEVFRFAYPDGPHDVEALLVHPKTGEVVVLTKEFSGRSVVYQVPSPLQAGKQLVAERVAEIDLRQLGPLGSAVTDAAISADARRLVVRTYVAALEYELAPGASLRSVWGGQPRLSPLDDGPQGEGITYRAETRTLLTIGEGLPAVLFQAAWHCPTGENSTG